MTLAQARKNKRQYAAVRGLEDNGLSKGLLDAFLSLGD